MPISFVTSFKNANGGTLTGLQTGDLVTAYAFRSGSNSQPSLPLGWTARTAGVTTNSAGSLCATQMTVGTSLITGTFTNATNCVFLVHRGVNILTPVGDVQVATGVGTTVTYPALTLVDASGNSWVEGLGGHRSTDTTINIAPLGMTNRDSQITTGEIGAHDTNGGVSSWSAVSPSVGGTSSGWGCYSIELIAASSGTTYTSTLTGGLSYAGAFSKQANKTLPASLSYVGALNKFTAHKMTAGLSYTGNLAKRIARSFSGGLSYTGGLAVSRLYKLALTAGLSYTGSLLRGSVFKRALTGGLSYAGTLGKRTSKRMTGGLSFTGAFRKLTRKAFTADLSFLGVLSTIKNTLNPSVPQFVTTIISSLTNLFTDRGGENTTTDAGGTNLATAEGGDILDDIEGGPNTDTIEGSDNQTTL